MIIPKYQVPNTFWGRSRCKSMDFPNKRTWIQVIISSSSFILSSSLGMAPSTYKFTQEMLIYPKLCSRGQLSHRSLSPPPAVLLAFFPESAKLGSSGAKRENSDRNLEELGA